MNIAINITHEDLMENPNIIDGVKQLAGLIKEKTPSTMATSAFPKAENTYQQPVMPVPQAQPDYIATAPAQGAPVAPTVPQMTAPVAPAAVYTLEQLSLAAAPLMDAGKTAELVGLLQGFGVATLQQLPTDKYNAFAVGIRGLGAQI